MLLISYHANVATATVTATTTVSRAMQLPNSHYNSNVVQCILPYFPAYETMLMEYNAPSHNMIQLQLRHVP